MGGGSSFSWSFQAMGSAWEVEGVHDSDNASELFELASEYLTTFEHTYSRFLTTSHVSQIRDVVGVVAMPPEGMHMIQTALDMHAASDGMFNLCVARRLEEMGYDAAYSLRDASEYADIPRLDEAVRIVDESHIELFQPVALDFGALGKGCAVDGLLNMLKDHGCVKCVVNGSGDMRHMGEGVIRVGLEHPLDPQQAIGWIDISNSSIASSGVNRRRWGSKHHIVNPSSHDHPDYIIATWVCTSSAMMADALATTLFLCPPDKLVSIAPFEYVMINKDMQRVHSAGWTGELF